MSGGRAGRWLLLAGGAAIAATVVAAITVIGTPAQQRASKLDARRVNDLSRIEAEIERFWKARSQLPADLGALRDAAGRRIAIVDPATGEDYAYAATGPRDYRLCAVFATDSNDLARRAEAWIDEDWAHPAGERCFARRVGRKPADAAAVVDDAAGD